MSFNLIYTISSSFCLLGLLDDISLCTLYSFIEKVEQKGDGEEKIEREETEKQ